MSHFIGNLFRKRRRELDISQKELADKVGVVPSYITQIERGKRNPSPDVAEEITKILKLDFDPIRDDLIITSLAETAARTGSTISIDNQTHSVTIKLPSAPKNKAKRL